MTATEKAAEKKLQAQLATQKKATLDAWAEANEGATLEVLVGNSQLYFIKNANLSIPITVTVMKGQEGRVWIRDNESGALVNTDNDLYGQMSNASIFPIGTEIDITVVAKYAMPRTAKEIELVRETSDYTDAVMKRYEKRLANNNFLYYHASGLDD
jgi:exosome complex RNA-binding protein Rrp4